MKVYCEDCRRLKEYINGFLYCERWKYEKKVYEDDFYSSHTFCGREYGEETDPRILNKNNDCRWFEPRFFTRYKYRGKINDISNNTSPPE